MGGNPMTWHYAIESGQMRIWDHTGTEVASVAANGRLVTDSQGVPVEPGFRAAVLDYLTGNNPNPGGSFNSSYGTRTVAEALTGTDVVEGNPN